MNAASDITNSKKGLASSDTSTFVFLTILEQSVYNQNFQKLYELRSTCVFKNDVMHRGGRESLKTSHYVRIF